MQNLIIDKPVLAGAGVVLYVDWNVVLTLTQQPHYWFMQSALFNGPGGCNHSSRTTGTCSRRCSTGQVGVATAGIAAAHAALVKHCLRLLEPKARVWGAQGAPCTYAATSMHAWCWATSAPAPSVHRHFFGIIPRYLVQSGCCSWQPPATLSRGSPPCAGTVRLHGSKLEIYPNWFIKWGQGDADGLQQASVLRVSMPGG